MVSFTEKGIRIGEKEIPFYCGAFHYWRSPHSQWDTILSEIKNLGFQMVETYIPWAVHEPEEGAFDFGEKIPEHNVDEFFSACERNGLFIIVRPGPHINAEMENFGFPEWVLQDREMTAKNPWGTEVVYPYVTGPYCIPSYASEKFYEKAHAYFRKLTPVLYKHAYPKGNIIAIQAENETCNFFRDNPFVMDYSRASLNQYHDFLRNKFKEIDHLNEKLQTDYCSFEEAEAPTGLSDSNFLVCMEWVKFKEFQILEAIRKIIGFIDEMNLDIPVFHNCAYQTYSPISVQRDEQLPGLSVAGMDLYSRPQESITIKERIRFLAGSSRLCFVPEFGSGSFWDEGYVLTPKEQEFNYLYAFMHGMKAVNFYMLAERNRWTGCPVKNNGVIRKVYYDSFRNLLEFLYKNEIWADKRTPRVLLLKNYDIGRIKSAEANYGATSLDSNCFVKGPGASGRLIRHKAPAELKADGDPDMRFEKWIRSLMEYLDESHIDYDISDMYIPEDKLQRYDFVFASMYPLLDHGYGELLQSYAVKPAHHLYYGPFEPEFDEYLMHTGENLHGRLLQSFEQRYDVSELLQQEDHPECKSASSVEMIWHKSNKEGIWHLYAANTTCERKRVSLKFEKNVSLEGIWETEYSIQNARTADFQIDSYTVQVFRVSERRTYA